jgi:hypothetical protein
MKKRKIMKKIILLFLPIVILTGCLNNQPQINKGLKDQIIVNIEINEDNKDLDYKLLEIAKKSEIKYNKYIELLTQLKKEKKLSKTRIPRNMGKRLTFSYDGYSLVLIKEVLSRANYDFDIGQLIIKDSKVISREYDNTTIIDILEDLSTDAGFDLEINEKKQIVKVYYK